MDSFKTKVRSFDAFPKVAPTHTVRSTRGSYSTVFTVICILFIFWVEVGGWFGGYIDHQFAVDEQIRKDLYINMDLLVAMPCEFIHTNVRDITDDRFLASELLNYRGTEFQVPPSYPVNDESRQTVQELDEVMREALRAEFGTIGIKVIGGSPACHIYGSIPVNRVSGDFHITGKGYGYKDRSIVPYEALNFSHVISEFSYGEFYPFLHNPLDFTAKVTPEHLHSYKYYAKVVPTIYQRLGIVIDTNQYSITESSKPIKLNEGVPGIFFKYDFEPIKLNITEERIPFLQFIIRLATICGGLIVCASWLMRILDKALVLLLGKKFAMRGQEKSHNLLDSDNSMVTKSDIE